MLAGCTPWPEEFAARYRAAGIWRGLTIPEAVEQTIAAVPDKVALIDGERVLTYKELGQAVDQLACAFIRRGLKPLDRVVFQLGNSADLVVAFFALLKAGAIPVLALPAHRQSEIGHFLSHTEATAYLIPAVVRGFDYREMASELARGFPRLRHVFVDGAPADGQDDLRALMAEHTEARAAGEMLAACKPAADEVALMLLSGGTTAIPKMIPRTHDDYVYNFTQCGKATGVVRDAVFLAVLPMAHNFTLACPGILGVLAVGGTVVVAPATTPEIVFPLIERHRVTMVCTAVPLVTSWLNSEIPERHDLSSLEVLMNGGAKLVPELRRRIEERFGCRFMESFGTGEGLLNNTRRDDPEELRFHSSGHPISPEDELRVVDPLGDEVPDGTPGELQVRGPYTIRGYYKAPEANAAAFTADGFYRMGDVVKRVNGYLYVEGRMKDLVNRGGEKISCEEVENHILAHPAVAEACVVAMPDKVYGEKACAFVITRPGVPLDFDGLIDFIAARKIAKFKLPERLEIVDAFPISPAGKILRRELRARIAAKLETEGHSP
jgi:2,3-dihydroxybenzoate-AMP ligase